MSEVIHLRNAHRGGNELSADLHVHMYGDAEVLGFVLVAELGPIGKYFADRSIDAHWWYAAPDRNRFCALTLNEMTAIGALVWHSAPTNDEQLALL